MHLRTTRQIVESSLGGVGAFTQAIMAAIMTTNMNNPTRSNELMQGPPGITVFSILAVVSAANFGFNLYDTLRGSCTECTERSDHPLTLATRGKTVSSFINMAMIMVSFGEWFSGGEAVVPYTFLTAVLAGLVNTSILYAELLKHRTTLTEILDNGSDLSENERINMEFDLRDARHVLSVMNLAIAAQIATIGVVVAVFILQLTPYSEILFGAAALGAVPVILSIMNIAADDRLRNNVAGTRNGFFPPAQRARATQLNVIASPDANTGSDSDPEHERDPLLGLRVPTNSV